MPSKGYKQTKEQKENISKATKKAMARPEVKEKMIKANKRKRKYNPWNKGLTKEIDLRLRKRSNDLKGHDFKNHKLNCQCPICKQTRGEWISKFGKEAPNWQNGKSFEPYPLGWNKTFKEQIRFRDGYKCQICGCPEVENNRKLAVHHIDYNKENLAPENLISLCNGCHSKTNGNRKYWTEFLKNIIKV